jgi:palmitoyltransferase
MKLAIIVDYLLNRGDQTAAIPILCIYFITFTLMIISLTRLLYVTTFHPPYIPLGSAAIQAQRTKRKLRSEEDALSSGEYDTEKGRNDPDSAGLELFYTKDCFVTEADGRPIWCSHCATWKLDRTHHDSTSGRCIAKMDHFCPWVGGPIGENNFKYFIQYTFWTALYCLHLLIVMAIYIRRQISSPVSTSILIFCVLYLTIFARVTV